MKKTFLIAGIIATLATTPIQAATHTRKAAGIFTSKYTIETRDGHRWKVSRASKPGRRVVVTFNTKGTRKKTDDIIIKVKRR